MTHGSLFSGIGGFDLAAHWMGWTNLFHCEWNEFGQSVLKYYWPNAESFTDITQSNFTPYRDRVSVLTGGFPCQPFSRAGNRKGSDDERYMWPQMFRAIKEVQPRWVVAENVRGLVNWPGPNGQPSMVFEQVCSDMESEGYCVQSFILGAVSVNAPHRRDRVWIVAHRNNGQRTHEEKEVCSRGNTSVFGGTDAPNTSMGGGGQVDGVGKSRLSHQNGPPNFWEDFPIESPICSGDDGVSLGLDGITFQKWRVNSLQAYGNAIVPQVAYRIFNAIHRYENG